LGKPAPQAKELKTMESTRTAPSIQRWMRTALERQASDLHLVAGDPPSLRIDGKIHMLDEPPLTKEQIEQVINELLPPEKLRRLRRNLELDFSYEEPELGRFRGSLFFERGRLAASFRVVPPQVRSVEELGLPVVVYDLVRRQDGLILVTGPVGMGKTTTLNTMIDLINSERYARIITIEDPIEFVHRRKRSVVLQREVHEDTRSFARALVAALRQDPNVICVGEMRDLKTVATALTAAETGHLVLSTLHTVSAAQTVDRIIDVFPPHQQGQVRLQLANVLQAIICQKLLPRSTGQGRVLAYEVLIANAAVRRLIKDGKEDQLPNVLATGKEQGMMSMDHCILNLLLARDITLETALMHSHQPELIRRAVGEEVPTPR
jgi:twitching motility protein PilT